MAGLLINSGGFSPTTGTLGSGVTFPDGTVIDFQTARYTGSDISSSTGSFVESTASLRIAFTPTSPNKIILVAMGGLPRPASSQYYTSWATVDTGDNSITQLASSDQGLTQWGGTTNYPAQHTTTNGITFVHTPGSYGSEITYVPIFRSAASGTSAWFTEGAANQNIQVWGMEVQQ